MDNPASSSHLKTLNLISSAKFLLPCGHRPQELGHGHLWGGADEHYLSYQRNDYTNEVFKSEVYTSLLSASPGPGVVIAWYLEGTQ